MAWWDTLPIRSGRLSASGTSFWYDRPGDPISTTARLASEELDVALIDAMCASSKGTNKAHVDTWDGIIGGPVGGALISVGTQFDWSTTADFGFGYCISHLPKGGVYATNGSGWLVWVIQTIPATEATSLASSPIWAAIIAGTHDAKYVKFGERIVTKMAASGHPLKRLIIDANHEMNQSNHHRIWAGNRTEYKAAMERTYLKIREGANNITPGSGAILKFMHRPGSRVDAGEVSPGPYNSYVPATADVLGLSIHPDGSVNTAAKIDQYFAGTLNAQWHGINEVLATSISMNLPIAFPEWAPRFETTSVNGGACPIANTFVQKWYDQVIQPNRAKLVCDCVHNQNVRDTTGYLDADAGGQAQWASMVTTRKSLWVGIQSDATVPTSDSFSYTVADDWGTRTANVAVTVQGGAVLFVNATDDAGETGAGNAVVIPVLDNDNASASLLPLVVQPGSVTTPVPSGTAVITTDNKIRYTPASGVEGTEATFSYTAKPSSAAAPTSTALVRVQILTGPPPPPTGQELPTPLRTILVGNASELTNALGSGLRAGDHIKCAPNTYAGTFTPSVNGTAQNPIFITRQSGVCTFTGTVNLTRDWGGVHRLRFTGTGVNYGNRGNRVTRCLFENANISDTGSSYPQSRFDHNEFRNVTGPVIQMQMERATPNQGCSIDHNYFNGHSSTSSEHVMQILTDTFNDLNLFISDNLFTRCMQSNSTGQSECVGIKVGGVTIRNNTFVLNPVNSTGGAPNISLREAARCTVIDNWFENGFFIRAHGDDHVISNNRSTGKVVDLQCGDAYGTDSDQCSSGKSGQTILVLKNGQCRTAHCAIRRARCEDNQGAVNVGTDASDPKKVRDVTLRRNSSVNITGGGIVAGTINDDGNRNPNNTARKLSVNDVGPDSA